MTDLKIIDENAHLLKAGDRVRYVYCGTEYEATLEAAEGGDLRSTAMARSVRGYYPWVVISGVLAPGISGLELIEEAAAKSDNEQSKKSPVQIIGAALLEEAEGRGWCSEFDDFVDDVNGLLDGEKLPTRKREFSVSVVVTVEATSDVEARRITAKRIHEAGIDWVTVQ